MKYDDLLVSLEIYQQTLLNWLRFSKPYQEILLFRLYLS